MAPNPLTSNFSEELIEEFTDYLKTERRLSHNTYLNYGYDLKLFCKFLEGKDVAILDVQEANIREFIAGQNTKGLSAQTVNRRCQAIRGFYKFLCRTKRVTQNPTEYIQPLKTPYRLPTILTPNQIEQLFESLKNAPLLNQVVFHILYDTGIRIAELAALKVSDINFETQALRIVGKDNKERSIPLLDSLLALIKTYLEEYEIDPDGWLFPVVALGIVSSRTSHSFRETLINPYLKPIAPNATVHTLRHNFATRVIERTHDLAAAQALLGHSSPVTTQRYVYLTFVHLKEIIEQTNGGQP